MRETVMALLKAGYLTQSEAATIAGVTRQRVQQWVRKARIHPAVARERHLRKLVRHAQAG